MLYILATPIGNLDDLSYRQAKTLAESDIILAEDTRSAQILLKACVTRYKLHVTCSMIKSYYKEKEMEKLPEILTYLRQGKKVSLISESGIPLISDPGYLLIKAVVQENIPFTVIPGPSSITTALVYSGFKLDKFCFLGFFPRQHSHILQLINQLESVKKILPDIVFIFFESAIRINQTLQLLDKNIPQAQIVICREMTKMFEEIIRGKPKDLMYRKYKGELTVVLSI